MLQRAIRLYAWRHTLPRDARGRVVVKNSGVSLLVVPVVLGRIRHMSAAISHRLQSTKLRVLAVIGITIAAVCGWNPTPASALTYTTWAVTGTFNDGGSLSGLFTFNTYGYLSAVTDLTTTGGAVLPGQTYSIPPGYPHIIPNSPPPNGLTISEPDYQHTIQLEFASILVGPPGTVISLLLGPTQSFECVGWSCNGSSTFGRYFVSGDAIATPLPAALPLLTGGLVVVSLFARRKKLQAKSAIAGA